VARKKVQEKPQAEPLASDSLALTIPQYLEAQAGSGTVLMYALDDKGERILSRDAPRANADAGLWKEVEVPMRWVAVIGVVDNQGVREALALERKIKLAEAYADYKRVDIQRQVRSPEGDWSSWRDVDENKNYEVLDNLPELSKERTPEDVRPPALVDPLPLLKKGTWSGVDHGRILRLPKPGPDKVAADVEKFRSPLLAIRCLDFTLEPGTTYRYRVRVLLVNPDKDNDGKKELFGPWSEPTREVTAP
jgi:hypothetical protein